MINTVAVTGNESDPDTTNNTATQTTVVVDPPAVPGLSTLGTAALAVAMAGLGFLGLSRRRKGLTQASSGWQKAAKPLGSSAKRPPPGQRRGVRGGR